MVVTIWKPVKKLWIFFFSINWERLKNINNVEEMFFVTSEILGFQLLDEDIKYLMKSNSDILSFNRTEEEFLMAVEMVVDGERDVVDVLNEVVKNGEHLVYEFDNFKVILDIFYNKYLKSKVDLDSIENEAKRYVKDLWSTAMGYLNSKHARTKERFMRKQIEEEEKEIEKENFLNNTSSEDENDDSDNYDSDDNSDSERTDTERLRQLILENKFSDFNCGVLLESFYEENRDILEKALSTDMMRLRTTQILGVPLPEKEGVFKLLTFSNPEFFLNEILKNKGGSEEFNDAELNRIKKLLSSFYIKNKDSLNEIIDEGQNITLENLIRRFGIEKAENLPEESYEYLDEIIKVDMEDNDEESLDEIFLRCVRESKHVPFDVIESLFETYKGEFEKINIISDNEILGVLHRIFEIGANDRFPGSR
jgi:hypothetical protein